MPYDTLLLDVTDHIALVTINRPDKLNALNATVIRELGEMAGQVAGDDGIHGLIITGAGTKAFVAGADIGEIAEQGPLDGTERSLTGQAVFRKLE
ncbi:MAG TPA: enoyl-CoA hydratase/isomerase family protein, partial [Gemmatimonadales bacterium]|nr:enoyl-CoA hydratase/isomerase family protein [Gemmatimonadales bacterium]